MKNSGSAAFKELHKTLANTPVHRFPLPMAFADPAFMRCIEEASSTPELITEFDRLYGCKVGRIGFGAPIEQLIDRVTGFQNDQIQQFAKFVHESVYLLIPAEAVHAFRIAAELNHTDGAEIQRGQVK